MGTAGTIIIDVKKDKLVFCPKCPICGKDLTKQVKDKLGIIERHKYLPLDAVQIYDEANRKNIDGIVTKCCWLTLIYKFKPNIKEVRKVNQTNIKIEEIKQIGDNKDGC